MYIPKKINVFYTNMCNLHCKHCYVRSLIKNNMKMKSEILYKIIDMAVKWNVNEINITGGEPTLFIDELEKPLKYASSKGITLSIYSNLYWANSNAELYIEKLKSFGVKILQISTDSYHQEYINLDAIVKCIDIAQKNGIRVIVTICSTSKIKEAYTIYKISKVLNKENIKFQYTANFGSAKDNKISSMLDYKTFENVKCNKLGEILIRFDNKVFACCGPPITFNENNELYLGDMDISDSDEFLYKINNNELILKLLKEGPCNTLKLIKPLHLKTKYSSLCEFCNDIINLE